MTLHWPVGGWVGCSTGELEPRPQRQHMLSDSPIFFQKNLLINLNRRESPNLPGMAVELYVGFLSRAVID